MPTTGKTTTSRTITATTATTATATTRRRRREDERQTTTGDVDDDNNADHNGVQVFEACRQSRVAGGRAGFTFLNLPVCERSFCNVLGIGANRLGRMRKAVEAGAHTVPADMRYLRQRHDAKGSSDSWALCVSFLEGIYESVAEALPDGDCRDVEPGDGDDTRSDVSQRRAASDSYVDLLRGGATRRDAAHRKRKIALDGDTTKTRLARYLPHGSIMDYYNQFQVDILQSTGRSAVDADAACPSYVTFWRVWKTEFSECLRFRGESQHATCSICTRHKLLIRSLSGDILSRHKQITAYRAHLQRQYLDRRAYWRMRGLSRLRGSSTLCMILDGMDQAKFATPRCPEVLASKELASMQRPRLHVSAVILHGWLTLMTVGEADLPKDSNCTIDLINRTLQQLNDDKVDLTGYDIHVQMDNCCRENKCNPVFRYMALLVAMRCVRSFSASFLQTGHSHEDIDALFSSVAVHVAREKRLEEPADFVETLRSFLASTKVRPFEAKSFAEKVDSVLDWRAPQSITSTQMSATMFRCRRTTRVYVKFDFTVVTQSERVIVATSVRELYLC
jgi:hypothetical protein